MAVFKSAEQIFRDTFPGAEADELLNFFDKIWRSQAGYKVFMARRAFNFNFALMRTYEARMNSGYRTDTVMSDNALLLRAGDLAAVYTLYRAFPRIMIIDDILLHGRSVQNVINSLKSALCASLREEGAAFEEEELDDALTEAVEIRVFAENDGGILLDPKYRVYAKQSLPKFRLRELSQQISDYLQSFGIANTSFVLSGHLTMEQREETARDYRAEFPSQRFCYRGRTQLVYCRNTGPILETVRIHCPDGYSRYEGILTSLALPGSIKEEDFRRIRLETAKWLDEYVSGGRMTEILMDDLREYRKAQMQLLMFLLSVLCFSNFFRIRFRSGSNALYRALLRSDYDKIAMNFDAPGLLAGELEELFYAVSFENAEEDFPYGMFEKNGDMALIPVREDFREAKLGLLEDGIYTEAENIFYRKGMEAEAEAERLIEDFLPYNSVEAPKDTMEIGRFLRKMRKKGILQDTSSIGTLLGLMDSGLLSLNAGAEEDHMKIVLKAGELATYVYARRFSVFMPALAYIERRYMLLGCGRKEALADFIRYLQEHCYSRYGETRPEDRELLLLLQNEVRENDRGRIQEEGLFLLYRGGQTFQEWNANLITCGDRSGAEGNKSEHHFSEEEERLRKEYYLELAEAFVREKETAGGRGNP